MKYTPAKRIGFFRKVALSLWHSGGDPSVYGFLDLDLTDSSIEKSPLPFVLKSLAEVMKKHRELNSILRFGKLYYREQVNISVLVHIEEQQRSDLSFAHLTEVDKMSLQEIRESLGASIPQIRARKDPRLHRAFQILNALPSFLMKPFLKLFSFAVHDLNLDLTRWSLPKDPFGAVIVTNVGSLGLRHALVPLVPFSKAVMMVAVGEVSQQPKVINGEIVVRSILPLGVTFDHRFFDGAHAAKMLRDFEAHFHFSGGSLLKTSNGKEQK
ncbi:2-oxo acid dehydrogenase subunit E2 [Bdellovibrio svalbardensis]|uniref:2-oxo acid dehydrogenase subunit E2 n=1 Tax=Bdellovibrio svalbardensis TaxID=2972972 RepID=A0ABT6DHM1_9BACT|nr:2-oxo acid dehydrogenase subunit E2 [Bdellovibrio svalbardensis]MDG0815972.1 2-oxo acid dehydrogenase subunit E2 [Bdellovibrio svalbardensis]